MKDYKSGMGDPYWFEWQVGIIECLKMLYDLTIDYVIIQDTDFESIDDVVLGKCDKSINIQVKHTSVDENFTISFLLDEKNLIKWAKDWDKNGSKVETIKIITNRKFSNKKSKNRVSFQDFLNNCLPKLKENYDAKFDNKDEENTVNEIRSQLSFLGEKAKIFISLLEFEKTYDLLELEEKIKSQIAEITNCKNDDIISQVYQQLISKLRIWTTNLRDKKEIYREDVYQALSRNYNLLCDEIEPDEPIFPSRVKFKKKLQEKLNTIDNKVIIIYGSPGIGKTNFVSYLQKDNSIMDFRFYTYEPLSKSHGNFVNDYGKFKGKELWVTILEQLKKKFIEFNNLYEIKFPLIYDYITPSELKTLTLKFLKKYSEIANKQCVVFIDGIDHAARFSNDIGQTYLSDLPMPNEIEGNVKFVIVGQPDYSNYPLWFKDENVEKIIMPGMTSEDVELLFRDFNNEKINIKTLSENVIDLVGNNTLNVLFAIMEIKQMICNPMITYEEIIENLNKKNLNNDIVNYYESIYRKVENSQDYLKLLLLFSFSFKKLSIKIIQKILNKEKIECITILENMYPLIINSDYSYYAFHNDVKLYFKKKILYNQHYDAILSELIPILNEILDLKHDILAESLYHSKFDMLDFINLTYFQEHIVNNFSFEKMLVDYQLLFSKFIENINMTRVNELSTIMSTISQYDECFKWKNEGEHVYNINILNRVYSEKYQCRYPEDIQYLINDCYFLLKNDQIDRALNILKTKIKVYSINNWIDNYQDGEIDYEKIGYICRYFIDKIIIDLKDYSSKFFTGWIDASIELTTNEEEFKKSLELTIYDSLEVGRYILHYVTMFSVSKDVINQLLLDYEITMLEFLKISAILKEKNLIKDDVKAKLKSQYAKLFDDENSYQMNIFQMFYYYNYIFCDEFNYVKEYEKLLVIFKKNNIKDVSRGYKPAIEFLGIFNSLIKKIKNHQYEEIVNILYEIIIFKRKNGHGTLHDIEYYESSRIIFKIINKEAKNTTELANKICDLLVELYEEKEIYYLDILWDLIDLFVFTERYTQCDEILDKWICINGDLWKNYDISDVNNYLTKIVDIYKKMGFNEKVTEILKRESYRRIGYIGNKDYSIYNLIDWYKLLPDNEEKIFDYGMRLFSISEIAKSIGDNRGHSELINELFDTAIKVNISSISSLFEFNNTPEKFYYWRETLLDRLYRYINSTKCENDFLVQLKKLVNSWISDNPKMYYSDYETKIEFKKRYLKIIDELLNEEYEIIHPLNEESNDLEIDKIIKSVEEKGYLECIDEIVRYIESNNKHYKSNLINKVLRITNGDQGFLNEYVIPYILKNSSWGYYYTDIESIIKESGIYFDDKIFEVLLRNVYSRFIKMDLLYEVKNDLEIISLSYAKNKSSVYIKNNLELLIEMHKIWIGEPVIKILKQFKLTKSEINDFSDFVELQLDVRSKKSKI